MKYYENMEIRQIDHDVFAIDTGEGKYLMDGITASLAHLNDHVDFNNEQHICALLANLDPHREAKRVFSPQEYISNHKLCRLMMYLNLGCNMRCIYCHCDSTEGDNMSDEMIKKTVDKYFEHIKNRLDSIQELEETPQITFMGGGEPFLRINKIKEVVRYFSSLCETVNLKPRYVIVTNTSLGSDEDWKWLVENEFLINLSLDGPESIQNRNRPLYGGKESFPIIKKRLEYLSSIGASCHVRSTVIKVEDVPEICTFFKQFPCVKTHALEPVSLAGRAKKNHLDVEIDTFYSDFFKAYSQFLLNEPERFKSSWFSPFKRTEGFCGAVYCNSIVLPDGTITLCSEVDNKETREDIRSRFIVSNVNNDGDVYESPAALSFSESNRLNNMKYCMDCPIKYKCGGGCYIKRVRDFYDDEDHFYNTFCRSAIALNVSFLIGCLDA